MGEEQYLTHPLTMALIAATNQLMTSRKEAELLEAVQSFIRDLDQFQAIIDPTALLPSTTILNFSETMETLEWLKNHVTGQTITKILETRCSY